MTPIEMISDKSNYKDTFKNCGGDCHSPWTDPAFPPEGSSFSWNEDEWGSRDEKNKYLKWKRISELYKNP